MRAASSLLRRPAATRISPMDWDALTRELGDVGKFMSEPLRQGV